MFDENLRQLVNAVLNQPVTRARDRRRPLRHVVDRRAHDWRAFYRQHSRHGRRRSELPGKTLYKNCPNLRRLHPIRETSDGFGFQTCPTAHFSPIEEGRKAAQFTPSLLAQREPTRGGIITGTSNLEDRRLQNGGAKILRQA
ncbi:MAG: hypothetical protein M3P26_03980 [Gemmatimonadota bacterium]|nr:hypothetical protein [Gemmatimonadota bacterium]